MQAARMNTLIAANLLNLGIHSLRSGRNAAMSNRCIPYPVPTIPAPPIIPVANPGEDKTKRSPRARGPVETKNPAHVGPGRECGIRTATVIDTAAPRTAIGDRMRRGSKGLPRARYQQYPGFSQTE